MKNHNAKHLLFSDFDSGRQVDEMLAKGRAIMHEALEQYKPVAVFGAWSGGNDSVVTTHFACSEFGAAALTANTQIGLEKTRAHQRDVAKRYGWQHVEVVAPVGGMPSRTKDGRPWDCKEILGMDWMDGCTSYEEACFNFGMPGPSQHARMYQRLKERCFDAAKREAKQGKPRIATVMFVSGIRHDESAFRAGYKTAVSKVGASVWVNPFYFCSATDFAAYRDEFGLPRNKQSDAIGISGECLCGAFAKPGELDLVAKVEPETAEYIRGIERVCESRGLPCKWGSGGQRKTRPKVDGRTIQLELWGPEPEFRPACVGCDRRSAFNAAQIGGHGNEY